MAGGNQHVPPICKRPDAIRRARVAECPSYDMQQLFAGWAEVAGLSRDKLRCAAISPAVSRRSGMAWDWTVRLVLPVLMVLLAAVIYEILRGPRAAMSGMERVAIALLAVTMLGMAGWWVTS